MGTRYTSQPKCTGICSIQKKKKRRKRRKKKKSE